MADAPIITLQSLSFGYPTNKTLLHDIDFSLIDGEHIGLMGPNGCGKTTLFQLIVGLQKPTRGRVLYRGSAVEDEQDWWQLRCKVGLVLQHAEDQLFCPTVLDDVAFGPLNLGLEPDKARTRALETLECLGLSDLALRLTHRLSGGEKKLVSLATVMAMQPDALLLDEPTNGLDPDARDRLIALLKVMPTARIAISHDWDFLEEISSTCMTIAKGRLETVTSQTLHTHRHIHAHGEAPHEHR